MDTTLITVLVIGVIGVILLMLLFSAIRVVQQYERGIIFVLGRLIGAKGPGIFLVPPFITRMTKVDLRIVTLTVPPQEVITRDNVTVKVTAVIYFYVVDPAAAITNVVNFLQASTQLAQAASVIGVQPAALQLRYLQTLTEIAVEKNSTIVFPLPIDLIEPMIDLLHRNHATSANEQHDHDGDVSALPLYPQQ